MFAPHILLFLLLSGFAQGWVLANEGSRSPNVLLPRALFAYAADATTLPSTIMPDTAPPAQRQSLVPSEPVLPMPEKFERRGLFMPKYSVTINAARPGRILRLNKDVGQYSEANEVLVEIDCLQESARIEELRLLHEEAKIKRRQMIAARQQNEITPEEMSLADLDVEISLSRLNRLRTEMENCKTRAPFAGFVHELHVRPGQNVAFSSPMLEIVSDEPRHFTVAVPISWLKHLQVGTEFTVYANAVDQSYAAKVSRIDSAVDVAMQTIVVTAEVMQEDTLIRSGMHGEARFYFGDK